MFILSAVAVGPALTMAVAYVTEWITGKQRVDHKILLTIARFSGFALLAYAYIKVWDLAAVTYYGKTPAVSEALNMLYRQTAYNFGFWFGEIIVGLVIPIIFFLVPRFNRNPKYLVLGALCAVIGVIFNRWDITVTGLYVPCHTRRVPNTNSSRNVFSGISRMGSSDRYLGLCIDHVDTWNAIPSLVWR